MACRANPSPVPIPGSHILSLGTNTVKPLSAPTQTKKALPGDNAHINNIGSLEGLRGLACLSVVFSHAGNQGLFYSIKSTGQMGVIQLFSLSGFRMS